MFTFCALGLFPFLSIFKYHHDREISGDIKGRALDKKLSSPDKKEQKVNIIVIKLGFISCTKRRRQTTSLHYRLHFSESTSRTLSDNAARVRKGQARNINVYDK